MLTSSFFLSLFFEQDYAKERYSVQEINQSRSRPGRKFLKLDDLTEDLAGEEVLIRGRLHNTRGTGKMCFVVLRQQRHTIQGVLTVNEVISKQMVKFVNG